MDIDTSFPNDESYNEIKEYMYSGFDSNILKKNQSENTDIQKTLLKYKSLFNYITSQKSWLTLNDKEVSNTEETDIENSPLVLSLKESSYTYQNVKDFPKYVEFYESLGPE